MSQDPQTSNHSWDEKSHSESRTDERAMQSDADISSVHPNWWSRYREPFREYFAEFLGVTILVIFGTGVDCQVVLSNFKNGDYQSISWGWAIGTAMGVWVAGGISGGHINPAVTVALATWRGFPWRKVPGYIIAQLLGGIVGGALTYANYVHAIDAFEGKGVRTLKTAGLFSTYAAPYMTSVACFFSEFLATAVLLIVVLSFGDKKNNPPPAGLAPVALFFLIFGIGCSLGVETGYALNPARDLGPRLVTSMVGYGKAVYTFRNQYWLWTPILGPLIGAQFGCAAYDILLYTGEDSIVNKPRKSDRKKGQAAGHV